jgi:argininosuccinate lyase
MSRFRDPPDPVFQRLNSPPGFDLRLAPHDIEQSKAHVGMLVGAGVLTEEEAKDLRAGLDRVARELEDGSFSPSPSDEDVHMAIERRLTEIVGPLGGKLHTARSRNDQVATDLAIFVRTGCGRVEVRLADLMGTLVEMAERHLDWPMPGYTHLQRAQPVYVAHHLLAYFWMFKRDSERFRFCRRSTLELPLGAGALSGVSWNTSRAQLANELGFESVSRNSLDAVSNRDFVLDFLSAAAISAMHLSRLGAEIVIWTSQEFRFLELADSFTSGSSIMPQKKNPDAAELLRAKAPRLASDFSGLLGVLHALPLAYNKDLQEDKHYLFDAADTLELGLEAANGMLHGASFDKARLADAASDEFLAATEVADLLVKKGVPFREAHGIVGSVVRYALEGGQALYERTLEERARV